MNTASKLYCPYSTNGRTSLFPLGRRALSEHNAQSENITPNYPLLPTRAHGGVAAGGRQHITATTPTATLSPVPCPITYDDWATACLLLPTLAPWLRRRRRATTQHYYRCCCHNYTCLPGSMAYNCMVCCTCNYWASINHALYSCMTCLHFCRVVIEAQAGDHTIRYYKKKYYPDYTSVPLHATKWYAARAYTTGLRYTMHAILLCHNVPCPPWPRSCRWA